MEKFRDFFKQPDFASLFVLVFSVLVFEVSNCFFSYADNILVSCSLMFVGAIVFPYFSSEYIGIVLMSCMLMTVALVMENIFMYCFALVIAMSCVGGFAAFYFSREGYVKHLYVTKKINFIKIFIFANITPTVVASFLFLRNKEDMFWPLMIIFVFGFIMPFILWQKISLDQKKILILK